MKTKIRPSIVGGFVIAAFALFTIGLLVFGGVSFAPKERVVIYFNESIHGLDEGSPVQLRGVRIGRVVDLHIRYDAATAQSTAVVDCVINPESIRNGQGAVYSVSSGSELQALVKQGLRAQLNTASLATGLLYIELEFYDPKAYPPNVPAGPSDYPVIPSVPSTSSEFQAAASQILGQLRRVDFVGLSNNLKALLADARTQVDGLDLKGLSDQWKKTGESVDLLVRSPAIPRILANLDASLVELRGALADVHATMGDVDHQANANGQQLQAALGRLQTTLRDFDATAVTVRRFVSAQQNLGYNTNQTMEKLGDASEAVQRLADFLERNPNAVISGKKPPP